MDKRPYIICHMIMSIDGKILTRRWRKFSEAKLTGSLYESTASQFGIGSWLVGTTTMKELSPHSVAIRAPKEPVPRGDFIALPEAETYAIGTDTNGILRFRENEIGGDHIIVIITDKTSDAYRAHLRKVGISYIICGREKIDLALAMKKLRANFNLSKILLEGGGVLNGAMLQGGLIDEISQIIMPIVDGGGPQVTGFFDPPGKASNGGAASLRLISQKTLKGGAQWLRYRVRKAPS